MPFPQVERSALIRRLKISGQAQIGINRMYSLFKISSASRRWCHKFHHCCRSIADISPSFHFFHCAVVLGYNVRIERITLIEMYCELMRLCEQCGICSQYCNCDSRWQLSFHVSVRSGPFLPSKSELNTTKRVQKPITVRQTITKENTCEEYAARLERRHLRTDVTLEFGQMCAIAFAEELMTHSIIINTQR